MIQQAITEAAKNGNLLEIETLLRKGASPNGEESKRTKPLLLRAKAFFKKGKSLHEEVTKYEEDIEVIPPLHAAAQKGHADAVKLLLDKGAEINMPGGLLQQTPLHFAVDSGHKDVVALLLKRVAFIDATDTYGCTPLYRATDESIMSLLLDHGATIDYKSQSGGTPLHYVAYRGQKNLGALLLKRVACIDALDNKGDTPLHSTIDSWDVSYDSKRVFVELLLNKGAKFKISNQVGCTPLHKAARKNCLPVMVLLLNKGALIRTKDNDGNTPLHLAIENRQEDATKLLLNHSAQLNVQNHTGMTPLHLAVEQDNSSYHRGSLRSIIRLLLKHGAYSYREKTVEQQLSNYWEKIYWEYNNQFPSMSFSSYSEFLDFGDRYFSSYNCFFIAGITILPDQPLWSSLERTQNHIEATVGKWLSPLELSKDVCREMTPHVLRALPRLLKWLNQAQKSNEAWQKKQKDDTESKPYGTVLHEILRVPETAEAHFVLPRLYTHELPGELLLRIREFLMAKALVATLKKCYPELSHGVADYLVNEVMSNYNACVAFHTRLFERDWHTPCEPPATFSMKQRMAISC